MSKKPLTMSVARPSRVAPAPVPPPAPVKESAPVPQAEVAEVAKEPLTAVIVQAIAPNLSTPQASRPRVSGSTARLEQGIKRIVVDVTPSVHKQVKVKAIDYPGGIKEYILRLLEADGLDLSSQPDFVPRPK